MKHLHLLLALACCSEIFGLTEDTSSTLANLMSEVNQLYTELHNSMIALQKNVDEVEATKKELQVTKAQLNTTISELQATKAQLAALNLELQDEKLQSAAEISALRNDLETTDERMNTTMMYVHDQMNITMMSAQITRAMLDSMPTNCSEEIDQCTDEIAALRRELETACEQINTTMLDLQETKAELSNFTSKLQDEKGQCVFEVTSLRSELALKTKDVSFDVQLSGADTSGSREPVKFNIVLRNEGNGYNATTGKFTAPVSGTYLFSAAIEMYGSKSDAYAQIVKTGSVVSSGYGETSPDVKTVTIPVATVTHMKQGEEVWVTRCCNVQAYGLYYGSTHFVGALLSVD